MILVKRTALSKSELYGFCREIDKIKRTDKMKEINEIVKTN